MFDFLFGSGRQTNRDDAMQSAQDVNRYSSDASSFYYDNIDGKWDGMGEQDRARVAAQYNQLANLASNQRDQHSQFMDLFDQEEKDNRYNYFGNGIIGAILNPIGQTASAAKDLVSGQYGANDRDIMSDLGAAAGTALTAIPFAGGALRGMGAARAGSRASKAINSIPGMAATGAGFGVADAMRHGGSETDWGEAATQAGMGAAFGAAIPVVGRVAGRFGQNRGRNVLTRDMQRRGMEQPEIDTALNATPNRALYATAARSLIPQSTLGRGAAIGGGLLAANHLLASGGEPQIPQNPAQNVSESFASTYGYRPSEQELVRYLQEQHLMSGGY